MSTSISRGCGVVRSCGSTPQMASTRRPCSSMRSLPGKTTRGDGDELASLRTHLALDEPLDHRRRARALGNETGVNEVATHHAEQAIAQLVVVHDELVAVGQLRLQVVP